MNFIIFAGNRYYPQGGALDIVGIVGELVDTEIFETVVGKVRKDVIGHDARIWVNAVSIQPGAVGETRHWEVRMVKAIDDPALQFCSHKEMLEGLGACGIMPLGHEVFTYADGSEDLTFHALLDPEKRDITYLP